MKDMLGARAGWYKLDETLAKVANWYLATIKMQIQIQTQILIQIQTQLLLLPNCQVSIQSGLLKVSLKVCKRTILH